MFSTLSLAYALRGELKEAERCAGLAGPIDAMESRTRAYADRALVWRLEDPGHAAELAITAGERAESGSHVTWGGALLYHDAVRLGRPNLAVRPLARLANETTAPLVGLMARHASAAAGRDAQDLASITEEFLAAGSPLFAAETCAEAAARELDGADRARWLATATHVASCCDGASTPALADLTSPLTARELEIATLAAAGTASGDISKQLWLSVRTVENTWHRSIASLAWRDVWSSLRSYQPCVSDKGNTASGLAAGDSGKTDAIWPEC